MSVVLIFGAVPLEVIKAKKVCKRLLCEMKTLSQFPLRYVANARLDDEKLNNDLIYENILLKVFICAVERKNYLYYIIITNWTVIWENFCYLI